MKINDSMPLQIFLITCLVLLVLAVIGFLACHVKAIIKNKGNWKAHPKNNLMFSYFCGSGAYQRELIYKDTKALLNAEPWFPVSLATLAHRLEKFTPPSKVLKFFCTLVNIPIGILGLVEAILTIILGYIYLYIVNFVHWLILLVLGLISHLPIPLWQLADKLVRIDQHCPHCYETFNLPAFRCSRCGLIHKDLVPSRCGMIIARCKCGRFMASSALTGRSQLDAVCPACRSNLAAANVRQFSIQLVGGKSSGKTAFLAAFQHLYLHRTSGMKKLAIYGKPEKYFDDLELMYRGGPAPPRPSTSVLPYSLLHKIRRTSKVSLVIYDIPAEVLLRGDFERNPRNFGFTDGVIIIVDPLSIASVREECLKSGDNYAAYSYSANDVNEVIVELVQKFYSITGRAAKRQIDVPVAIVINKADVKAVKREIGLLKIKATFSADPDAYLNDITLARDRVCRAYLEHQGLDNALNNLDGHFSNVRYFPVSAMGHFSAPGEVFEQFGVMEPITWIISESNKTLIYSILRKTQDFTDVS
jgi:GTPase SAR1 family protein